MWRSLCAVIPRGSGCRPRSSTSVFAYATTASTTSWRRLGRERALPAEVAKTGSSDIATRVDPGDAGVASALVNATNQVGGSLGLALLSTRVPS